MSVHLTLAAGDRGFRWQVRAWLLCGRRDKAEALLLCRLQRRPDDAYALASLAHLQASRGDPQQAAVTLEHLVRTSPSRADAWFNLGYLYETTERPAEAVDAFRKALALQPSMDQAWYGVSLALIRLQRWNEAVEALNRTVELQPMSPSGWYQLAKVHVDCGRREEAATIIRHLDGFEPRVARQLTRETGIDGAFNAMEAHCGTS